MHHVAKHADVPPQCACSSLQYAFSRVLTLAVLSMHQPVLPCQQWPACCTFRLSRESSSDTIVHAGLAPKQRRISFTSTWRLPADADSRRASAELDNGMLRVSFWRNC
jgi:hypothetical protein